MDLISTGKKWSSDKAHSEVAYCLPLMTTYATGLQTQGIDGAQQEELKHFDELLMVNDKGAVTAQMRLEMLTDRLTRQLNTAISSVGTAYSYAARALRVKSPETLDSFSARAEMSRSVDKAVRVLNDTAAFVTTYRAELTAVKAPLELEKQLAAEAETILETNNAQEAAKQAVDDAAMAIYETRGNIYATCGLVYLAGRTAFRKTSEVRSKFSYQYLVNQASKSTSSSQGSSTQSSSPDGGTPEATTPAP